MEGASEGAKGGAMELSLRPEEATLLVQILTNHLTDLRGEIPRTELYELRQALKRDEALVKVLLARLEQLAAAPAPPRAV